MNRRDVVLLFAALGIGFEPFAVAAAQSGVKRRIGFLFATGSESSRPILKDLRDHLRLAGYEEGKNLLTEWRFAEGKPERLFDLAEDLVRNGVELIVAGGNAPCLAAMRATKAIPIVLFNGIVPVEMGLVRSLARPGGNVTGTTNNFPEFAGKVLEILKETVPQIKRVAVLWNSEINGMHYFSDEAERAAKAFGIVLQLFSVARQEELDGTLQRIAASRPDALYFVPSAAVFTRLPDIAAFAIRQKLPSVGTSVRFAAVGGLLYYGPDNSKISERTVSFVDRIFRGANPAELPIEQPTNFELVVNTAAARSLGLKIPQSVLLRAVRVIE